VTKQMKSRFSPLKGEWRRTFGLL